MCGRNCANDVGVTVCRSDGKVSRSGGACAEYEALCSLVLLFKVSS